MNHAPAPVHDRRPQPTGNTARKRTGLIAAVQGSDHMLTFGRGTKDESSAMCRVRDLDTVRGANVKYICLHDRCASKSWDTLATMYAGHPAKGAMDRADEAHVFALWSADPVDAGAVEAAKVALVKAEKARKALPEAADEATVDKADERLLAAKNALSAASAPIGLIAPPELRPEDE